MEQDVWVAPQRQTRMMLWVLRAGMQPSFASSLARQTHADASRTGTQHICVLGHENKVIYYSSRNGPRLVCVLHPRRSHQRLIPL